MTIIILRYSPSFGTADRLRAVSENPASTRHTPDSHVIVVTFSYCYCWYCMRRIYV
jgi:hypothetical protein